jgi:O-antigen/teichoic acid export membrane protein
LSTREPEPEAAVEDLGAAASTIDYGKTAGFLSVGVGLTGVITYAYFAVAAHVLDRSDYGQIAVLWSAVFITVSTLYRPIDQLLSRHISERLAQGQPIGEPMRVAATIQVGLALLFAVLALALRGPLEDGLLEGNETLYWILFTSVLAYAASYFARGYLAGNRRFGLFSTLILAESIFRTTFAVIVAIGLASGQSAVALGIVAAPCLSLFVVPLAFVRRGQRHAGPITDPAAPGRESERPSISDSSGASGSEEAAGNSSGGGTGEGAAPAFTLTHGAGFAAAVLLIMLSEQTFLNAGPLLIRATEGAAIAGFIFNVLMIARAPLQLFQAVSTSLLPHLTNLHHGGEEGSEEAFQRSIRLVLGAIAAFTALVALAVLIAGPQLMQAAWSKKFSYDRPDLLIVTAGMGLYLAAVTFNQAALAQGQVRRASARWIACAAGFVGWNLLPFIDAVTRVEIGFTLSAAILCGLLYLLYRHPRERTEDLMGPGSTQELEAQLAAADEGS